MKIKVCGITNCEDAEMALALGADALGFNFFRGSPRYIDPLAARSIVDSMPPFATAVGIFVNVESPAEVTRIAKMSGVQILQLHGNESPDYCRQLAGWPLIKVWRIGQASSIFETDHFAVRAFLLDTADPQLFGGTGRVFDWSLWRDFPSSRPVILAGGLNPENVATAICAVRPYAVDVCSGVENAPGRKDALRLRAFISEVRNVCGDSF